MLGYFAFIIGSEFEVSSRIEGYPKPSQTSKMGLFAKIIDDF